MHPINQYQFIPLIYPITLPLVNNYQSYTEIELFINKGIFLQNVIAKFHKRVKIMKKIYATKFTAKSYGAGFMRPVTGRIFNDMGPWSIIKWAKQDLI